MRRLEIAGETYGRLTAIEFRGIERGQTAWLFRCTCGTEIVRPAGWVRSGRTSSCGCLPQEVHRARLTTHGQAANGQKSSLYTRWVQMIARCEDPGSPAFLRYGGRGIRVCARWRNEFAEFAKDMGEPPAGLTLDRIDVNGDYEPDNCRWASATEQVRNRRLTIRYAMPDGEPLTLKEIAIQNGVRFESLWRRVCRGGEEPLSAVAGLLGNARTRYRPL